MKFVSGVKLISCLLKIWYDFCYYQIIYVISNISRFDEKFNKMYEIWRLQPYFEVWFVPLNSLFHACTAQAMRHYLQITGRDIPLVCTKPGDWTTSSLPRVQPAIDLRFQWAMAGCRRYSCVDASWWSGGERGLTDQLFASAHTCICLFMELYYDIKRCTDWLTLVAHYLKLRSIIGWS